MFRRQQHAHKQQANINISMTSKYNSHTYIHHIELHLITLYSRHIFSWSWLSFFSNNCFHIRSIWFALVSRSKWEWVTYTISNQHIQYLFKQYQNAIHDVFLLFLPAGEAWSQLSKSCKAIPFFIAFCLILGSVNQQKFILIMTITAMAKTECNSDTVIAIAHLTNKSQTTQHSSKYRNC